MSRSSITSMMLALLVLSGSLAGPSLGLLTGDEDGPLPCLDWPEATVGASPNTDGSIVWLRSALFDPLSDGIPRIGGLDGTSSRGVYLVQFDVGPDAGLADRLEDLGVEVLGYVPEDALVLRVPRPSLAGALALWGDVRWLCPWQDGWKVSPDVLLWRGGDTYTVMTWPGPGDATSALQGTGSRVLGRLMDQYIVSAPQRAVRDLTAVGQVCWIEPWVPPTSHVDNAARSSGARQLEDGPYVPGGTAVWSYDNGTDAFEGLTGGGGPVTITVTDSGIDGTHPAFTGRMNAFTGINASMNPWTDPVGHGTHVAGIVLGDGSYRTGEDLSLPDGRYAGLAPQARLNGQSFYGQGITFFYRNLTRWSVNNGADISHNSWGTGEAMGNYTPATWDYDQAVRDADWLAPGNQSILCVFSAGNGGWNGTGVVENSIAPPATGKNVIAVGAVGNGKPQSTDVMYLSSSRGWTDDGRIKPDLVAPGANVSSTRATGDNIGLVPPDGGDASYLNKGGTSMAAPVVSGAAALVIDQLRTEQDHEDPSPAVVKSILLASADHMPGTEWPGRDQGWGRLNVSRAVGIGPTQNTVWVDQTTQLRSAGETVTLSFDVAAGTPVSFALVWTDLPSSVYVGKNLVNDLDLQVKSPSGLEYRGNVFSGGESTTGGSYDRRNNVEMVYFDAPEAGEWVVTVRCHELPPVSGGGLQDFALTVVGNVQKKFVDLAAQNLSVRATDAAEGDVVPILFDLANLGNLPAASVSWQLDLLDEGGAFEETLDEGVVDVGPRSGKRLYTNWTAVRGIWTIVARPNPLGTIAEESYQNNDRSKEVSIKGFGVSGKAEEALLTGAPGTDVRFTLNITNEGNTLDLFLLERSEPPAGWDARLDVSFLEIGAGGYKLAHLTVSVPAGGLADESILINVTVESQGNSTHFVNIPTRTRVAAVYAVAADMESRSQKAVPGDDVTFTFLMTNVGNAEDTYRVSYEQTAGPTLGVEFSLVRTTFSAAIGETVSGNITVMLDADSMTDLPVDAQVEFDLSVVSLNDGTKGSVVPAVVIIEKVEIISLIPPLEDKYVVAPGTDQEITMELTNEGNGPSMVSPTILVPDGWGWRTNEPSLLLEVGQTKSVQMWVEVSDEAGAGDHLVTLQVVVGQEVKDTASLTFSVDWTAGISIQLDGPYDRTLTQGEELTLAFTVRNVGNNEDKVSVSFSALSRGLRAEAIPSEVDVPRGGSTEVVVVFNASLDAELLAGQYTIFFKYFEDLDTVPVMVNITIEQRTIEPGPPDGDGEDEGGISSLMVGVIALVVLLVVVAVVLTVFARRRREDAAMQEEFFMDSSERRQDETSRLLEEERSTRPDAPSAPSTGDWVEDEPKAPPVRSGSANCPECGSPMQPLKPGSPVSYCPMCGHQEGN